MPEPWRRGVEDFGKPTHTADTSKYPPSLKGMRCSFRHRGEGCKASRAKANSYPVLIFCFFHDLRHDQLLGTVERKTRANKPKSSDYSGARQPLNSTRAWLTTTSPRNSTKMLWTWLPKLPSRRPLSRLFRYKANVPTASKYASRPGGFLRTYLRFFDTTISTAKNRTSPMSPSL